MAARKYFIRRLPNFLLLHGRRRVDLTREHQHAVACRPPPSARRWPNLGRSDHWRHCTPRTTPWINVNRVYLLACYQSGSLRHCRHGSSSFYALAALYGAIKFREVRKFLAGAFFVSSGILWYLWLTNTSIP